MTDKSCAPANSPSLKHFCVWSLVSWGLAYGKATDVPEQKLLRRVDRPGLDGGVNQPSRTVRFFFFGPFLRTCYQYLSNEGATATAHLYINHMHW